MVAQSSSHQPYSIVNLRGNDRARQILFSATGQVYLDTAATFLVWCSRPALSGRIQARRQSAVATSSPSGMAMVPRCAPREIHRMSDAKVIFWDVYGTLVAARRGDLDSLLQREGELRSAFERTIHNFGLSAAPARLHDLFMRGIQAEREARASEGIAHPEVSIDEIWFKLLEKFHP